MTAPSTNTRSHGMFFDRKSNSFALSYDWIERRHGEDVSEAAAASD